MTVNTALHKYFEGNMVSLTMSPTMSVIRAYEGPDGYACRLPYVAVVTVSHLSDTHAYLHGAIGKINRAIWEMMLDLLRQRGITTVILERHGRFKTIYLN